MIRLASFFFLIFVLLVAFPVLGQDPEWELPKLEEAKLTSSDGALVDYFGYAVDVEGDLAIVGSYLDDDDFVNQGSATIFRYDSEESEWVEEQIIFADDPGVSDFFGYAVGISGDIAVVGAYLDDDTVFDSGAVYVFRYDDVDEEWVEEDKIKADDAASTDYFGRAVAVHDGTIVVGAHFDDDTVFNSGSVYVYEYDDVDEEWVEQDKLNADDAGSSDSFGWSVGIDGDVIIVGAYLDDDSGFDAGAAYLFRYDDVDLDWIQEDKITADDGVAFDYFGYSVGIHGDTAIAGAYLDDDSPAFSTGSAYIFRYDEIDLAWNEEQKLTASDSASGDSFGISVAIAENIAMVGSYLDDDDGLFSSGSAYAYRYDLDTEEWIETQKFLASDPTTSKFLGRSVSVDDGVTIVGAYNDATGTGAAYVYCVVAIDCNDNCIDDAFEIENGDSEDCNDNGIPDECEAEQLRESFFVASDADDASEFGSSVAADGNIVVVGAQGDDGTAVNGGGAYVFRLADGGWEEEQKLVGDDTSSSDDFGTSVAVSGDVIVVGSPENDAEASNAGTVYVYRYDGTTWDQEQTLNASDADSADEFGIAVAIAGDVLAVGAWQDDEGGSNAGAVYIFNHDGSEWEQVQKLTADDAEAGDLFGRALSLDGEVLAVGAQWEDEEDSNAGAVYVFRFSDADTWEQEEKLTVADSSANDNFGRSVSVSQDVLFVGAWQTDEPEANSGSVYVFEFDGAGWEQQVKLQASEPDTDARFGDSVSVSGDFAIIGAPQDQDLSGAAYTFIFDGVDWIENEKLEGSENSQAGTAVFVRGPVVALGSPRNDVFDEDAGAVRLLFNNDCNGNGVPDDCDLDSGVLTDADGDGIADECEDGIDGPTNGNLFKRGDADGNGSVSALLDSLYILNFSFAGGATPPCLDAADVDGNNSYSALLDSLFLLNFAFAGGDTPPDPGPTDCGVDPEEDDVSCDATTDGC